MTTNETNKEKGGKNRGKGREFFIEMVKNDPRTRVTRIDVADTHIMLNLVQDANRMLTRARAQGGRGISIEKFAEILTKYDNMLLSITESLKELSKLTGVDYRERKEIKAIRTSMEGEGEGEMAAATA